MKSKDNWLNKVVAMELWEVPLMLPASFCSDKVLPVVEIKISGRDFYILRKEDFEGWFGNG